MSTVPRFFVPSGTVTPEATRLLLPPDVAHHAVGVLRLKAGESLILHDGENVAYDCVLEAGATSRAAAVAIAGRRLLQTEPGLRITVAQALPRTSEKIEQVLQHGTEVGAAGFILFSGARSVARLAQNEKVEKRLERWRGIVRSASEQSGRGVLPDVVWRNAARDVVGDDFPRFDHILLAYEMADKPLRLALDALPDSMTRILVLVGPEGGFSTDEVSLFIRSGADSISLGPRILRTETAALVLLSQILYARESVPSDAPVT